MPKPRAYQIAGIEKAVRTLRSGRAFLDMSDMGTGKTWKAGFVAKKLGLKLGVIAPPITLSAWEDMANALGLEIEFLTSYHAAAGKRFSEGMKKVRKGLRVVEEESFVLKSHPKFKRTGVKRSRYRPTYDRKTLTVFDEVQNCVGDGSLFSKLLINTVDYKYPVLMCSATPAENPIELKAILHALRVVSANQHWTWCQSQANCVRGQHGGLIYRGGRQKMDEIRLLIRDLSDRVRKSDLLDLPEMTLQTRLMDLVGDGAKTLDKAYVDVLKEKKEWAELPLSERIYARQISEHEKIVPVFQDAVSRIQGGCSVIIFYNFTDTGNRLQELAYNNGVEYQQIDGRVSAKNREAILDNFQRNTTHLLGMQIQAGGAGINAQDLTGDRPRVAFVFPTDSARAFVQATGRTHREGAKSDCLFIVPLAAKTVEEKMAKNLNKKFEQGSALVDGDFAIPIKL